MKRFVEVIASGSAEDLTVEVNALVNECKIKVIDVKYQTAVVPLENGSTVEYSAMIIYEADRPYYHEAEEEKEVDETKTAKIKKAFAESPGIWNYGAKMFARWCEACEFKTESFKSFVAWLKPSLVDYPEEWDFFHSDKYDGLEDFIDEWIRPIEQKDFMNFLIFSNETKNNQ